MGTVFTAMLSEQSRSFRSLISRKNFWIVLLDIIFIVFANLLPRIAAGNNVEASATSTERQDKKLTDIESLIIYSGIHERKYGLHRMFAKRFPYAATPYG